jgi:hypothetical protein
MTERETQRLCDLLAKALEQTKDIDNRAAYGRAWATATHTLQSGLRIGQEPNTIDDEVQAMTGTTCTACKGTTDRFDLDPNHTDSVDWIRGGCLACKGTGVNKTIPLHLIGVGSELRDLTGRHTGTFVISRFRKSYIGDRDGFTYHPDDGGSYWSDLNGIGESFEVVHAVPPRPHRKHTTSGVGAGSVLHQLPSRFQPGITDRYVVLYRYHGLTGELLRVAPITRTGEIDPEFPPHAIGAETPNSCDLWVVEYQDTPEVTP